MNIKLGIFLLSTVCLQMCGLQDIDDHKIAVQDQKPKSYLQRDAHDAAFQNYLQKVKNFIKKHYDIILPTITAVGSWYFLLRPRIFNLSSQEIKLNAQIDQALDNLPDYHGQKVWLSDDAKAHLKQLLQRVCNGETNDPAGEFLRYLRKPGVLNMDQAGIRTITMRIDQNPEVAEKLIRALKYTEILNFEKNRIRNNYYHLTRGTQSFDLDAQTIMINDLEAYLKVRNTHL